MMRLRKKPSLGNVKYIGKIAGFPYDADEICTLQGYYTEYSGGSLPTFRDYPLVPSSRAKKSGFLVGFLDP